MATVIKRSLVSLTLSFKKFTTSLPREMEELKRREGSTAVWLNLADNDDGEGAFSTTIELQPIKDKTQLKNETKRTMESQFLSENVKRREGSTVVRLDIADDDDVEGDWNTTFDLQPIKDKTQIKNHTRKTMAAQFLSENNFENLPQQGSSKAVSTDLFRTDATKEPSVNLLMEEGGDLEEELSFCEECFWKLVLFCDCTIL